MIRRFNYTERKRIEQEHITIELEEKDTDDVAMFNAELDFQGLGLPADAEVIIEAYGGRAAVRFSWGEVGALSPPRYRRLVNMPSNPAFRVKVVASDGSGVLLAMADHIRPHREEHHGALVWLEQKDLGKEVWHLDFDGNPRLLVNSNINGIGKALEDNAFRGLVMPEVLRTILVKALVIDEVDPEDEEGQWGEFLGFIRSFYHKRLELQESDSANNIERMSWIDGAVTAFTRHKFRASEFYEAALERH